MRLKFISLVILIAPAIAQQPRPRLDSAVGIGNRVITHIADGGGWRTSITLVNLSQNKGATFTLQLYSNAGGDQPFTFDSIGRGNQVKGTLAVGGSIVLKTTGIGAGITEGWGQFDGLGTTDSVGGFAVFSNANGNEAAVPFESTLAQNPVLPFDNTNGLGMGVALANANFSATTITATFKDGAGTVIGTKIFTMAPKAHQSFIFTDEWPFTAGRQGAVYFDTSDRFGVNAFGLGVLGLRFTPQGAFTSVAAFDKWRLD